MSIFTVYNKPTWYFGPHNIFQKYRGIIISENIETIPYSSYLLQHSQEKIYNDSLKRDINNESLSECEILDYEGCIAITAWMASPGHLIDSLLNLAEFRKNNSAFLNYKIILDIPLNLTNIIEMANILLGNSLINTHQIITDKLNRINNLVLIHNFTYHNSFLSFPLSESVLLNNYWNDDNIVSLPNVFITRGNSQLFRILKNYNELKLFFENKGFTIVNPENISNQVFYNIIKKAKNIIITNGSALCSLMMVDPSQNVKIFCLNSAGYMPEWRKNCTGEQDPKYITEHPKCNDFEKEIWKKVVSRYNFEYIDSWLNYISDEQCQYIMKNTI